MHFNHAYACTQLEGFCLSEKHLRSLGTPLVQNSTWRDKSNASIFKLSGINKPKDYIGRFGQRTFWPERFGLGHFGQLFFSRLDVLANVSNKTLTGCLTVLLTAIDIS